MKFYNAKKILPTDVDPKYNVKFSYSGNRDLIVILSDGHMTLDQWQKELLTDKLSWYINKDNVLWWAFPKIKEGDTKIEYVDELKESKHTYKNLREYIS